MPVSDPILHAVVIENEPTLARATRRWLRTNRVHTTEFSELPGGIAALSWTVDLVVLPATGTVGPGEPECFGADAVFRGVRQIRGLPPTIATRSGLLARALPIVLLVHDPLAMDADPIPGVVRAPVPLHEWEFLAAAGEAVQECHDALLDRASGVAWSAAGYVGTPGPHPEIAGAAGEVLRVLTRLRRGADALRAAGGVGAPGSLRVSRP